MTTMNRRYWLKTAVAAVASVPGAYRLATAADGRPRRKFTMSLSCGAIGVSADPRGALRLAHEHGFESVEPSAEFLAKLSRRDLDDVLADLKAKNLVWGAAGLPVDFRRDEATFRAGLARLPELASGLARAGVTRVGTWISPCHASLTYTANFRQHARRLRETAKVLDDHGLRLGLEYVGPKTSWSAQQFPFIHTMAEMKDLIAEMGCRNVGFVLDSWHWYNARETEADLLSLANRDVVACDLNDAPKDVPLDQQQDGKRELPAATGVIDLATFLGALVKIGYDGPIRAEPFNKALRSLPAPQALAATAAAMKKAFALVER
ncbi:MAG: sugar phosphate isomerase/epimerase [Thermoguttaceae bacterium]|jgi:sugar phosphate isomerase/epimerase|nr:sugar phosphate isomerase/epimerase [Thermoguttaceae bacterium]